MVRGHADRPRVCLGSGSTSTTACRSLIGRWMGQAPWVPPRSSARPPCARPLRIGPVWHTPTEPAHDLRRYRRPDRSDRRALVGHGAACMDGPTRRWARGRDEPPFPRVTPRSPRGPEPARRHAAGTGPATRTSPKRTNRVVREPHHEGRRARPHDHMSRGSYGLTRVTEIRAGFVSMHGRWVAWWDSRARRNCGFVLWQRSDLVGRRRSRPDLRSSFYGAAGQRGGVENLSGVTKNTKLAGSGG
jgi:hypothetical protein